MKIKNVPKFIAMGLLVVIPLSLTGCGKDSNTIVETKANYNVSVPRKDKDHSMKFSMNIPFYKITKNNPGLDKLNKDVVLKGNDFELTGTNVEALENANLFISQEKLSDLIKKDDKYYQMMIDAYAHKNQIPLDEETVKKMSQEEIEKAIKKNAKRLSKKEIMEMVKPYLDSYVVSGSIVYSGTISDDVIIKSISIPKYEFKYDFDNFNIKMAKHDTNEVIEDNGKQMKLDVASVNFVGPTISNNITSPLQGVANTKIDEIKMVPMNEDINIAEEKKKVNTFDKNKKINEFYNYSFDAKPEDEITGRIASFVYQIKSGGKTYWMPINQASCIDGKFLILNCFNEK